MTEHELAEIEEQLAAVAEANPAPWIPCGNHIDDANGLTFAREVTLDSEGGTLGDCRFTSSARLIARSPAYLADLVAEVRLLHKQHHDLRQDSVAYNAGLEAGRLEILKAWAATRNPRMQDAGSAGCWWSSPEHVASLNHPADELPNDVFRLLEEGSLHASSTHGDARLYASESEARADLAQAIVRRSRQPA